MLTYEEIERRFGPYSGPRDGWTDDEIMSMYLSGIISRDTAIKYHAMRDELQKSKLDVTDRQ